MPPNLESYSNENESLSNSTSLVLSPLTEADILFEENNPIEEIPEYEVLVDVTIPITVNYVPLEQNLRELLVRVTNTENLNTVTQVKLKVISRELTLPHLNFYVPNLRELILDGSVIESLRDIGNDLKNLKILRVNQCGLTCIDGVFGFENLEELYAADNDITSIAQCGFLPCLKKLNLRRNLLTDKSLTYLTLCQNLEEVYLEGNVCIEDYPKCKEMLQKSLKNLLILDVEINGNNRTTTLPQEQEAEAQTIEPNQNNNGRSSNGFSVTFPPRVCF